MQLVVDRQHAAVVIDDVDRVVGARDPHPRRQSGARTEPVISTVPLGRSSAICAIASASRVRKNGNADSGQIRMVASRTPVDCGPRRDPTGPDISASPPPGGVVEFDVLLQFGCMMRNLVHATIVVGCSDRRIAPKMPMAAAAPRLRPAPATSAARAVVDQRRRAREDRDRQERHAPQADQRRRLASASGSDSA